MTREELGIVLNKAFPDQVSFIVIPKRLNTYGKRFAYASFISHDVAHKLVQKHWYHITFRLCACASCIRTRIQLVLDNESPERAASLISLRVCKQSPFCMDHVWRWFWLCCWSEFIISIRFTFPDAGEHVFTFRWAVKKSAWSLNYIQWFCFEFTHVLNCANRLLRERDSNAPRPGNPCLISDKLGCWGATHTNNLWRVQTEFVRHEKKSMLHFQVYAPHF